MQRNLWISGCAVAVLAISCGPDDTPDNIITDTTSPVNNETTGSNNGTNNVTTGSNNGTNNLPMNNPNQGCEVADTFSDEAVSVERTFRESTAADALSCEMEVGEIATDGSYIARVEFSADTEATITVDAIENGNGTPPRPGLEIRRGACEEGTVDACATDREYTATFEAGVPYFLVVNGLLSSGGVSLNIDADVAECTAGERSCSDGVQTVCDEDGELTETVCPGGCMDDACGGDMCAAPLVVTPDANGAAIVLEGNRSAFTSDWDAEGRVGCEMDPEDPPPSTAFGEFWVQFEGVTAGQTIILDAEQSSDSYGFFVLETCDAATCLGAGRFDSNQLNRFTYTTPTDGDVLVAVEAMSDREDIEFVVEASVRE